MWFWLHRNVIRLNAASMESHRAFGYRDYRSLPKLSLGLSSVRLIVNNLEVRHTRASTDSTDCTDTSREIAKYDPNIEHYDFSFEQSREQVWNRLLFNTGYALSKCIPSVTFWNFGALALLIGLVAPRMISYLVVYPFCRLVFGTLYPAYASYKAVRTKNLKEYVKWMMYWIVFALFTCTETFTDVFLSWFPFYYEVKIVLVLWLLSPATKGSSILYRKVVHPALCRREQEIDEYIAKAKDQGYHTVLNLGTKGVNYATTVIMQTAIKGGGGLVQQLRKSYSLSDLTECEPHEERGHDEADDVLTEPRLIRRAISTGYSTRRSASESNSRTPMYFPEVDVDVKARSRGDEPDFSHIKSSEDISSGYSSADNSISLTRTASVGAASRSRVKSTRTTVTSIKRPVAAEENNVIIEELHDDDLFEYTNMPPLVNVPSQLYLSNTDPPFIYQYVGNQIKIIQVLNDPLTPSSKLEQEHTKNANNNNIDTTETESNTNIIFQDAETLDSTEIIKDEIDITTGLKEDNTTETSINESILTINKENIEDISTTKPSFIISNTYEDKATNNNSPDIPDNNLSTINIKETIQYSKLDNINTANMYQNSPKEIANSEEICSLHPSSIDNDSVQSDDEASFGTPEDSPKIKRKSPKGRYGKGKAPPPPKQEESQTDKSESDNVNINELEPNKTLDTASTTSQESLVDYVNALPTAIFTDTGKPKKIPVVNPIVEKKRRHKTKIMGPNPKANTSGIGKLLQLPGKLAFWSKNDNSKSNNSSSSREMSRRSSINERVVDEFQSCTAINTLGDSSSENEKSKGKDDEQISFKEAIGLESEILSHNIMEKSDALQKLIEAKLEHHPEYKVIPLNEDVYTGSKSTDV